MTWTGSVHKNCSITITWTECPITNFQKPNFTTDSSAFFWIWQVRILICVTFCHKYVKETCQVWKNVVNFTNNSFVPYLQQICCCSFLYILFHLLKFYPTMAWKRDFSLGNEQLTSMPLSFCVIFKLELWAFNVIWSQLAVSFSWSCSSSPSCLLLYSVCRLNFDLIVKAHYYGQITKSTLFWIVSICQMKCVL